MKERGKEFDALNTVNVTDYVAVRDEVLTLLSSVHPKHDFSLIQQAFEDFNRLFTGNYPGYYFCDTVYHDLQHTLDMTLALARLITGHEQAMKPSDRVGPQRAIVAIICALFHDSGYIRLRKDSKHQNGAEYTSTHVTRSARFLSLYLPTIGLSDAIFITSKMVHFTGYELAIDHLTLQDEKYQRLGFMLGTADLVAQMSDRCYLEKCRDRLYPEFVLGGFDRQLNEQGSEILTYASAEDLLFKTPDFYYQSVKHRLDTIFQQVHEFGTEYFGGKNIYMMEVEQNINYLKTVLAKNDFSLLRRKPLPNMATIALEQQKFAGE